MAKFRYGNLRLKDDQKAYFGTDNDRSIAYDGSYLTISGTSKFLHTSYTVGGILPTTSGDQSIGSSAFPYNIIYADSFYGDGSNITNVTATVSGSDHSDLNNLAYASSGHTGFLPSTSGTNIQNQLNTKMPLAGGTFTGNVTWSTGIDILAVASGTSDIGTSALPFGNIYCDDLYTKGSSIHIGNSEITSNGTPTTLSLKNGKVGIITTDPGATLDVEGDLILQNGTSINEFSIDGTLAGNSDDAVPTEKSTKTYVDARTLEQARAVSNTLAGDIDMNGNKVTALGSPSSPADSATKGYVDGLVQGLDWQDSVLDKDLNDAPGGPSEGDRYIVGTSASGTWTGHDNEITEYISAAWSYTTVTGNEGISAWVEDENALYTWNGVAWVQFGSNIDHANLIGIADDDHTQYILKDGTRELTGNWDYGSPNISGTGDIYCLGNMGVGTLFPDGTFHVHTATAGTWAPHADVDDLIVENSTAGGISIAVPDNQPARLNFSSPTRTGSYTASIVGRYNAGADYLTFETNGNANTMRIQSGKVTIGNATADGTLHVHTATCGTWAPAAGVDDLVVESSGATGISIASADGSSADLSFSCPSRNGASTALIRAHYNGGTDYLQLGTSGDINTVKLYSGTTECAGVVWAKGGIQPNSNAITASETLDDYEKGTWTPTLGGNTTYTNQTARYTKIGRLVYAYCYLHINVLGTGNASTLSGLPFTSNNVQTQTGSIGRFSSMATSAYWYMPLVAVNATTLTFHVQTGLDGTSGAGPNVFQNGTLIVISVIYQTD